MQPHMQQSYKCPSGGSSSVVHKLQIAPVPSTNIYQHQQINHHLSFYTSRRQMASLAALKLQDTPVQVLELHNCPDFFCSFHLTLSKACICPMLLRGKEQAISPLNDPHIHTNVIIQSLVILPFRIWSSLLILLLMFLWHKHVLFCTHCSFRPTTYVCLGWCKHWIGQ